MDQALSDYGHGEGDSAHQGSWISSGARTRQSHLAGFIWETGPFTIPRTLFLAHCPALSGLIPGSAYIERARESGDTHLATRSFDVVPSMSQHTRCPDLRGLSAPGRAGFRYGACPVDFVR